MPEAKLSPEAEERIENLRAFILDEIVFWVGHCQQEWSQEAVKSIMTYLSDNGFLICPTCAARYRSAMEIPNGVLTVTTDGEILSIPWEGKQ